MERDTVRRFFKSEHYFRLQEFVQATNKYGPIVKSTPVIPPNDSTASRPLLPIQPTSPPLSINTRQSSSEEAPQFGKTPLSLSLSDNKTSTSLPTSPPLASTHSSYEPTHFFPTPHVPAPSSTSSLAPIPDTIDTTALLPLRASPASSSPSNTTSSPNSPATASLSSGTTEPNSPFPRLPSVSLSTGLASIDPHLSSSSLICFDMKSSTHSNILNSSGELIKSSTTMALLSSQNTSTSELSPCTSAPQISIPSVANSSYSTTTVF